MLTVALLLSLQIQASPVKWYGPESVTFPFTYAGNPYDFEKNDLRVRFIDGKGNVEERLAFFDETEGGWRAVLVAQTPGKYRATLVRNGQTVDAISEPEFVDLSTKPIPKGFIRLDPLNRGRFRFDDGSSYLPLGFNLGWQSPGLPDLADMIKTMGQNGVNWTRVWACSWDGKNPWVSRDGSGDEDRMLADAFPRWDEVVGAADASRVPLQMVLFHHGLFSTRTDSNWATHPWNKAKGGFLEKPADFFTDPEAKRRSKMWLRYAVARWGHSPNVMAWELFNEVEWVDARYEDRWSDVLAWHSEMAEFLRSIDPYKHLVTTSSTFEMPKLYEAMDYYQPHVYPADVRTAISSFQVPSDKPLFFGEFGPAGLDGPDQRRAVRDGIWAGLLSSHAGAGSFWTWEAVHRQNLYGEFARTAAILNASNFTQRLGARPVSVGITTDNLVDMTFHPGLGWAKAESTEFQVEPGQTPIGLGGLPSYLQGPTKREMFPAPLTFKFRATRPGVFTLQLSQIAKAGAELQFQLDGKQVAQKAFPATAKDSTVADRLTVPYGPGNHVLTIENLGPDWVVMRSFTFTDMGYEASVQALGQLDWLMARVTASTDSQPKSIKLRALGLSPGKYEMTVYDLNSEARSSNEIQISGITHEQPLDLASKDVIIVFEPSN